MTLYTNLLKNPIVSTLSNHIETYPTPFNLSYMWSFGSVAGIALVVQIVTGVLLAMHYAPAVSLAFDSVEHIMRDVNGGVAVRYIHANGASMFLMVVYAHMFRGLYYGSYMQPRALLWYSGVVIFLMMMATAFMGYVLPWGQMSFWGATVITNLFSAIPGIGNSIVQLLWGGFSVDNPTLNRFFSLHYLVPFLIAGLAALHLVLLHIPGSNNPLGVNAIYDRIPFYPYFYTKDLFSFFIFVFIFSFFVIYAPNYMGHPDNYIEANSLVTPAHIVPEWYFLPFYAILRSIPDKLGGVLLMGLAIVILAVLPVVDTSLFRSNYFKPLNVWLFWYFFADSVSLGWIGQEIVETPFIEFGVFVTISYFLFFIPLLPFFGFVENAVISYQLRYSSIFITLNNTQIKTQLPHTSNITMTEKGARYTPQDFSFKIKLEDMIEFFKGPVDRKIIGIENNFNLFFSNLEIIQLSVIALFILFLGIFFPKSGEFTRFLNKLSFGYLIFLLWRISFGVVFRGHIFSEYKDKQKDLNAGINEDQLNDPFSTINHFKEYTLTGDEKDSVVQALQNDSLFSHLFFIYALLIVSLFLYGISDRFFISNSYELEFPILVFFLHIGAVLLISVHTLIEFVLAIEIITLGSYGLTAYERNNRFSTFAGVQYFVIGSVPSGLLILSIALIYKVWGTFAIEDLDLLMSPIFENTNKGYWEIMSWTLGDYTHVPGVAEAAFNQDFFLIPYLVVTDMPKYISSLHNFNINDWESVMTITSNYSAITVLALLLLLFNFLFKLTAAPFHFWAPSVYGKAPIATITFLTIFSKAMIFFALFKLLFTVFYSYKLVTVPFLLFTGVLSVLFGMIGAFSEKVIKRFFIYSSMGHVGFMLVGLSLSSFEGISATFHYLPVYIITSFIMWFILLHMGVQNTHITHFAGLRTSDPLLAIIFALIIFSMSGIPPLGGFFVKLDILVALLDSSRFYVNYILLLFTVASFFYYLRIIKIIFFDSEKVTIKASNTSEERLWLITILFLILFFYMFIVQKPLLALQNEALSALF